MQKRKQRRGAKKWQQATRRNQRGHRRRVVRKEQRQPCLNLKSERCKKKEFQPGVRVWSFSSQGRSHRPLGWTTARVHHLLSDAEYYVFLILDWARCVTDIREQFPLPLHTTLTLARRTGLSHPWDRKRRRYRPVTSDFVYALRTQRRVIYRVRAVKYEEALSKPAQLRSLELERVYWAGRDAEWRIILNTQIPMNYASNIEWVHPYRSMDALYPLTSANIRSIQQLLLPALKRSRDRCCDITDWCDARLHLPEGTTLMVLRYLIANRILWVDMHVRIIPTNPLIVLDEEQKDFLL